MNISQIVKDQFRLIRNRPVKLVQQLSSSDNFQKYRVSEHVDSICIAWVKRPEPYWWQVKPKRYLSSRGGRGVEEVEGVEGVEEVTKFS